MCVPSCLIHCKLLLISQCSYNYILGLINVLIQSYIVAKCFSTPYTSEQPLVPTHREQERKCQKLGVFHSSVNSQQENTPVHYTSVQARSTSVFSWGTTDTVSTLTHSQFSLSSVNTQLTNADAFPVNQYIASQLAIVIVFSPQLKSQQRTTAVSPQIAATYELSRQPYSQHVTTKMVPLRQT